MKSPTVSFRIQPALKARAEAIAEARGIRMSDWLRVTVSDAVRRAEREDAERPGVPA